MTGIIGIGDFNETIIFDGDVPLEETNQAMFLCDGKHYGFLIDSHKGEIIYLLNADLFNQIVVYSKNKGIDEKYRHITIEKDWVSPLRIDFLKANALSPKQVQLKDGPDILLYPVTYASLVEDDNGIALTKKIKPATTTTLGLVKQGNCRINNGVLNTTCITPLVFTDSAIAVSTSFDTIYTITPQGSEKDQTITLQSISKTSNLESIYTCIVPSINYIDLNLDVLLNSPGYIVLENNDPADPGWILNVPANCAFNFYNNLGKLTIYSTVFNNATRELKFRTDYNKSYRISSIIVLYDEHLFKEVK